MQNNQEEQSSESLHDRNRQVREVFIQEISEEKCQLNCAIDGERKHEQSYKGPEKISEPTDTRTLVTHKPKQLIVPALSADFHTSSHYSTKSIDGKILAQNSPR
jgi:hypothetical protein